MRKFTTLLVASLAVGIVACGDDKGDDKKDGDANCESNCPGSGSVQKFASGATSVEVSFEEAAEGEQYVLMPYALGDISTVTNAVAAETFSFSFATTGGSGGAAFLPLTKPRVETAQLDKRVYDHQLRTLVNRFEPSKGLEQGDWFWNTARAVDAFDRAWDRQMTLTHGFVARETKRRSVESYFRKRAALAATREATSLRRTTAAGDCPQAGGSLTVPQDDSGNNTDVDIPAGATVTEGADYCIVYLADPTTAGTKEEVEASVKEIMKRYKTVIYKDQFATVNGFTFKPVVAVIDFSNSTDWPSGLQFSGAFDFAATAEVEMPMLYMASDFQKLDKNKDDPDYDAALQKKLWHGTAAHELQHSIMDYYRRRVPSTEKAETGAVDEGLAHYMEDLFGYGPENFPSFVGAYLGVWQNTNAILGEDEREDVVRGGSQALWYYLIHRKGGVEFTDGVASAGGGLDYIAAVMKDATKVGPANLSAHLGEDWVDTIGNLYGAHIFSGSSVESPADQYEVQEPEAIKDLNGADDKTYGFKFNGFGGLPADQTIEAKFETTAKVEDVSWYTTVPVLYTVKDPTAKVKISLDAARANAAVSVVRIK